MRVAVTPGEAAVMNGSANALHSAAAQRWNSSFRAANVDSRAAWAEAGKELWGSRSVQRQHGLAGEAPGHQVLRDPADPCPRPLQADVGRELPRRHKVGEPAKAHRGRLPARPRGGG